MLASRFQAIAEGRTALDDMPFPLGHFIEAIHGFYQLYWLVFGGAIAGNASFKR